MVLFSHEELFESMPILFGEFLRGFDSEIKFYEEI